MNYIENLKPSGVKWLGNIPDSWGVIPSCQLFTLRNDKAKETDQSLTASQKYGVIPQKLYNQLTGSKVVQVVKGADILKHAKKNDFIISMRSFQGGIELCHYEGCVSSAYVVIEPSGDIDIDFFKYLFKSQGYIQALQSTSNLVRDGQALRYSNFKQIKLPLVPLEQQRRIGKYLDQKIGEIEKTLEGIEKVIDLLKQRNSHYVTHGFDNTNTVPTSLEWLDRLPEGWKIMRAKHLFRERSEKGFSDKKLLGVSIKYGVLPASELQDLTGKKDSSSNDKSNYKLVKKRDIAYNKMRMWQGAVGCSDHEGIISPAYVVLQPIRDDISTNYYGLLFRTPEFIQEAGKYSYGLCDDMNNLRYEDFSNIYLPVPPLDEQEKIVSMCTNSLEPIYRKLRKTLEEKKLSLISNAVTGKIKI